MVMRITTGTDLVSCGDQSLRTVEGMAAPRPLPLGCANLQGDARFRICEKTFSAGTGT
jgi:hypothetical protein